MNQNRSFGVNLLHILKTIRLKFLMNDTGSIPHQHLNTGLTLNVFTQILIRRPYDFLTLISQMLNHFQSDTRSHHPVGPRFNRSRSIGIDNNFMVRVSIAKCCKFISRTTQIQRAVSL